VLWNVRHSLHDLTTETRTTTGLIRFMARISSRPKWIVYNAHASARQHEQIGYDRRRTRIIPNGFDCDEFRPDPAARAALRGRLGLRDGERLIGLVARRHPVKDHGSFLRAAALLGRHAPDAHFLLVGRGTDSPEFEAEIAAHGLGALIHAVGERSDLPGLTAGLDIATSCSVAEAFPNVLGEAMACEVPCVATDVGDCAWVLGRTGKLVTPRDPEALAQAWRELLEMPLERRREMGRAARERVKQEFSLDRVAAQYSDLYGEVHDGIEPRSADRRRIRVGMDVV
jgi:glycosyltransferase involved in cell wall biosynthesis